MPIPVKVAYGMLRGLASHQTRKLVARSAPDARTTQLLNEAALWLDADDGTYQETSSPSTPSKMGGFSARFQSSNSEYLVAANDSPVLSFGTGEFTIVYWINPVATYYYDHLAKWNSTGNNREYAVYSASDGTMRAQFSTDAGASTTYTLTGTKPVVSGKWQMVSLWRDRTTEKVYIQVDQQTPDSLTMLNTASIHDGTETLKLGYLLMQAYLNGNMANVGIWKGRALSAEERAFLYNNGRARRYVDLGSGLRNSLVAWWDLDEPGSTRYDQAGPYTALGAYFTRANIEYLSLADNATVSMGAETSFTHSLWLNMTTKPGGGEYFFISDKGDGTDAGNEWQLYYNGNTDRLTFSAGNGSTYGAVLWGSALSAGVWYHITCWHDAVANEVGISVNNGTPVTTSYSSGSFDSTYPVLLGCGASASNPLNGALSMYGLWKRTLTSGERTILYNNGVGLLYAALDSSIKTSLVSYWNLTEASGTRADSYGSNNLTDNNTVTQTTSGPALVHLSDTNTVSRDDGPGVRQLAAVFAVANNEYLSVADNTDISLTSIGTWAAWVKLTTKATTQGILTKWASAAGRREYGLLYNTSTDRFEAMIRKADDSASAVVSADVLGSVSTGTWYLVVGRAMSGKLDIYVNASQYNDVPLAPAHGIYNGTSALVIGGYDEAGSYANGTICLAAVWKDRYLTNAEVATLYNGGRGLTYAELPADLKTNLSAYWDLSEATGTRYDSHGTNHLTDNNTVTQNTGPGDYQAAVGTWRDLSKNKNHLTAAAAANRPYHTSVGIECDGFNHSMSKSVSGPPAISDFVVASTRESISDAALFSRSTAATTYGMTHHAMGYLYAYLHTGTVYCRSVSTVTDVRRFFLFNRRYDNSGSLTGADAWLNGATGGTESGTPDTSLPTSGTSLAVNPGGNNKGRFRSIVAWNADLSTTDRRRLEWYLSRRFGITLVG